MDVEEYVDDGIVQIAEKGLFDQAAEDNFTDTFELLNSALGDDALRQYSVEEERFRGRVGLTALEIVAVGVSFNLTEILGMKEPQDYVVERVLDLWDQDEVKTFSRPGLRGTQRIQKTIPFGERWFSPPL